MIQEKQKIPLLLKLKRFKNSGFVRKINSAISAIKPSKKFAGIPERILLLRNDRIGDAIVTLPVIRDIKLNYPDIRIDVLASEKNKFIFEGLPSPYIDNIIDLKINGNETGIIYKLPVIGGAILSLKYIFLPFIFSGEFRKKIRTIREQKYNYAIDLVGLKRNALIAMLTADFTSGPGRLLPFLFYDYYMETNWVSASDKDFMTRKIENAVTDSTGIRLTKRGTGMPLTGKANPDSTGKFDLVFHFGSSELRKLEYEKERGLVNAYPDKRILVTDSFASDTFTQLQKDFAGSANVSFKLYPSLRELAADSAGASMFFCYDGGQAHYLSQYVRTITVFGPGSPGLWKPYEFSDYELLNEMPNGVKVMRSGGHFKHLIIFKPMWCSPCFDTGCSTRPCLNTIDTDVIVKTIQENTAGAKC